MHMDLRLKPATVSAGDIAGRGSFVDLGDVPNPRTDRKHGWISVNESRFRVNVSGKPRAVCVEARPELQVFPFDERRDIRCNNVESLEREICNAEKRTCFRLRNLGVLPTEN